MAKSFVLFLILTVFLPAIASAQSEWSIPITVTPEEGVAIDLKVDFLGDRVELYNSVGEVVDAVDRGSLTPEELAEAVRLSFNAAIRNLYGVKRDPKNHPIDGEYFAAWMPLMCWSNDTSQFVVKR